MFSWWMLLKGCRVLYISSKVCVFWMISEYLRTKIGGGVHFSVCVFLFDITFQHTSAPKLETVGCLIDCLPLHQAQSAELNVELIYIWQIPVIRFHDTFVVASEDATKLIEVIDLPLTQVHVFWSLELLVQLQFNFQSWNLRIWQVPRFLDSLTSGHWALGILGSQVWLPTSRVVRGRNYQERGYGCQLSAQLR